MKNILLVFLFVSLACSQSPKKTESPSGYSGLGKESVSETDLKKYAPPSLTPQAERQIREMMDISSPGMGMLSPDKKRFFFTWKITGVHQIWSLESARNFPVQLTGGKDSTRIEDITPDGKWLITSQDKDGAENPGIYLMSQDGLQRKTIFENPKIQAFLSFVSPDSKFLIYSANDEKADSFTYYKYDLATGNREKMFREDGRWFITDYSKDGRWLMGKAVTNTAREYYEYNLKTKELKPLLGKGENEEFQARYAKNEKDLLVITPKFGDFSKLYLVKDGKWKELFAPKSGDVESLSIDEKRTRILISTNEEGYFKVHGIDAVNYKAIQMPKLPPAEHISVGNTTLDGSVTMFSISTYKSPRMSYAYNWNTKKLQQWVHPSTPGVNFDRFVQAKLEYYTAKDGTKIPMFVRRPPQCEKQACPVIVDFHGGPEGQSVPGFSPVNQLYLDNGFIYVEPNVRGSSGYGKTWLHSDNQAKRLNVITDIEDAAKYIRANWKVTKIGVMGGSYGGYSTFMAMTKFAGAYDAGVASIGMTNLITFLQNTAPYRRALRTPEYGDLEKDHDALVALSPVTYINQLKSPLMIIQGVNDPRVPAGEAIQFQKTLENKGIASSLILFADEGHGAEKKDNQVLSVGHTLEFFKKHLKN
ncbi:prolyl oligopeptidase family serine peptidase [Bdellovibrio sp. HCB337]|uniref:alpha/beta hydrolase family protein n=1 Tax=Bdellovibrio sp. HCB337 TaxID=3394358 RepID=UPI0039A58662